MYVTKLNLFGKCLIVFLMFVLCGCDLKSDSEPQNIDKNFIDGEICNPPCWHGLVVNKSTKGNVISTLNTLPFVEHNRFREYATVWANDIPATQIQFICASDHTSVCGGAVLSNDILRNLWTVLEYDLALKDVVNKLGIPEFIEYQWPSMSGDCLISVVWNTYGTAARIYDDSSYNECEGIVDGNKITPDIVVYAIAYFPPGDFGPMGNCCKRIAWPGFKDEQY